MSISPRCVLTFLFFLLAVPMLWAQSAKTSIIIERQLVRFITPGEAVEWRLVVANQQSEVIFDSGPVYGSALDWPLKNQQGEAIESGLYTYTLSSKAASEETARTQRGHLMLARPSERERIWITNDQSASIGADSSAIKLAVIGSGETTVSGVELPGSVPRREASAEQPESPQRATPGAAEKTAAPAATNGTANRVAKFAADGSSLVDSTLTEVNGNVGIGTTNPQSSLDYRGSLAPFFTRDIGPNNALTAQSALQLGLSNAGSRFAGVGPSMLFFGENSAGNKSYLGRVSAVWENPTAGQEAGALFFQTRAGSGDVSALTERMRITASGNVGIGAPSPVARLQVASAGNSATSYTARFQSSPSVAGAGGILFDQNSTYGWKVHTENTASTTGTLNFSYVNVADGSVQAANTLVLTGNGQVVINATTTSAFGKLSVYGTSGVGIYGESVSNDGVRGSSGSGYGVYGSSNTGYGVYGNSASDRGVSGYSTSGVGVYGHSGSGYAGYFNGDVRVTGIVCAANVTCSSDARLKQNVTGLSYGLPQLLQLRPVSWQWKDPSERQLPLGLIAQEVEGVIPELVLREADPAKPLGLNYLGLVPVLIKAIQEQQATITALKAEQERQLKRLQARIARLERTAKKRNAGQQPLTR
jgi:hypothetical protein